MAAGRCRRESSAPGGSKRGGTCSMWPVSVTFSCPVARSQTLMVRSAEPVANHSLPGSTARDRTHLPATQRRQSQHDRCAHHADACPPGLRFLVEPRRQGERLPPPRCLHDSVLASARRAMSNTTSTSEEPPQPRPWNHDVVAGPANHEPALCRRAQVFCNIAASGAAQGVQVAPAERLLDEAP